MKQGYFEDKGELFFEIDLIAADGSIVTIEALLDTGFTDWLVMDIQDAESLGWLFFDKQEMRTARGDAEFNLYEGRVRFDIEEFNLLVLGGTEITGFLMGLPWLENRRLVVDRKAGLLTLGE